MVTYKVTLLSEEHNINTTLDCNDDVLVLDAAEELFGSLEPDPQTLALRREPQRRQSFFSLVLFF